MPANEAERLAALRRYRIVDSEFETAYQEVAQLAATICDTPIALVSLIDADRQWFKAKVGLESQETARDIAFCSHAIMQKEVFEVPDALDDDRFADNPLVTSDPSIRFYAGAPLVSADGYALGTLCAIDRKPRKLSPEQITALQVLAKQIGSQLELRLANHRLQEQADRLSDLNDNRNRLFRVIAHDLKSPFQGLLSITEMLDTSLEVFSQEQIRTYLSLLRNSTGETYTLLENLLQWAMLETGSLSFAPETVPLARRTRSALAVLRSSLAQKNQTLEFHVPEGIAVTADLKMLEAILRNLVANASKFTPRGGHIAISAEPQAKSIRLCVTDNGVGIADEKRRELLQGISIRSADGTAGEQGTGLGFRLIREFVEQNRGTLDIEAVPTGGTRVCVSLPCASEEPS